MTPTETGVLRSPCLSQRGKILSLGDWRAFERADTTDVFVPPEASGASQRLFVVAGNAVFENSTA
jgi:hypothetical protein